MALTDKLAAIGDAIRKKTGKSELLTLDNMVKEIQNLSSEDLLIPQDYVDYVRVEATEVANKVREHLTDESIVCIRASDSHIKANSDGTFYPEQTSYGNLHAIMAIRALTYMIPVDFIVHNGDVGDGTKDTTPDALKNQIQTYNKFFRWASNGLPVFIAIGNHDTGIYYHQTVADGTVYTLPGSWLYDNFTAYSESDTTIFSGEEYGGYCYRDFPSKKLRVFLLNTSEQLVSNQRDNGTLESQQLWFANALKSLNVDMGSDWNIMVFSHYALDYGDARPITNVLKAYIAGESITVGGSTVNFSGYNNARFLYQGHGHHHCFLASKLHYYGSDSVMKEYNAWRLCCPNGEFNRDNYYAGQLYYGLDFGEPTTYGKTPNTAEDVSMIIEVTNPSEEKIYRICYGAGYHRTVGIGNVIYYGITKILSNVTLSNDVTSIVAGEPYSASLTINNGYDLKNISITMGEDGDITGEVYQNGIISIPSVTGDVVITIKASARPNFTNLVDTAIDTDGNIIKYTDGIQLSNSGAEQSASAFTVTGYIKTGGGAHTYRIAGDNISFDQYGCVIAFYNEKFEYQGVYTYNKIGLNIYYGTVTEEDSTVLTWTTSIDTSHAYNCPYMRISVRGSGKNLIVTKDEEVTYGGGAVVDTVYVTQNLTNVTSSNSTLSAKKGSSFETTLSGISGYAIDSVTVIMGTDDITADAYTSSTGTIRIDIITGDVTITANAIKKDKYTNILPLAVDGTGTSVYGTNGYKTNTRLSSSNPANESSMTGMCCTGYIPIKPGETIRIKNFTLGSSNTGYINLYHFSAIGTSNSIADKYNTLNSSIVDGVLTHTIPTAAKSTTYVRLCCSAIDDTTIITVNEEIV